MDLCVSVHVASALDSSVVLDWVRKAHVREMNMNSLMILLHERKM